MSEQERKRRILVIDDAATIHQDFWRLLCPERSGKPTELAQLRTALFGVTPRAWSHSRR
jgi:hypothetical protein